MSRNAKRARLEQAQSLLHTGSISTAGLARLLDKLSSSTVPQLSRMDLVRANMSIFDSVAHSIELDCLTGGPVLWEFCDPNKLVAHVLANSESLQRVWAHAAEKNPPSPSRPWRLVLAFDEFSPGNKLKVDNKRKVMNVHFTFLELGQEALWCDSIWFTPVAVRVELLKRVRGGWSRMLAEFLKLQLTGDSGLATVGLALSLRGQARLLFATVHAILADGEGLQKAFDWKGAGSLKPCLRHWNVLSKGSDIATRRAGLVEMTCCDSALFKEVTDQDLRDVVDALLVARQRVDDGLWQNSKLENMQKMLGFSPLPCSLIADRALRPYLKPLEACRYDWVHSAMQDGSLSVDVFLITIECERHGFDLDCMKEYFRMWEFPEEGIRKTKNLWRIFEESRNSEFKLRMTCSECLGMYAIMRHFVQTRLPTTEDRRTTNMSQQIKHALHLFLALPPLSFCPLAARSALIT
jgi:hypothetical protein